MSSDKKEPHPFIHFREIMDSIVKDELKGAQLKAVDAEQRINELSYLKIMNKYIEKKDKFEDRQKGHMITIDGWRSLFQ